MTDYGDKISDAVDAPAWAKEQVGGLKAQVVGKRPFEIEEISFAYAQEYEFGLSMREAMYEGGYSGEHTRVVLGIVLRDELIRLA